MQKNYPRIRWNKLKECAVDLHDSLLNEKDYEWIKLRFDIYAEVTCHEDLKFENI